MIVNEDCIKHLKTIEDNYFDSVVTDPPYHLTGLFKRHANSTKLQDGEGPHQRLQSGFMKVIPLIYYIQGLPDGQ